MGSRDKWNRRGRGLATRLSPLQNLAQQSWSVLLGSSEKKPNHL